MSIIRVEKREDPYVRIDRATLEDKRLSWEARGLLAYLLTKPNKWQVNVKHLSSKEVGPTRRDGVLSILRELKKYGYVHSIQRRGAGGKLSRVEYIVCEKPICPETPKTAEITATGSSVSGEQKSLFPAKLAANGLTVSGPTVYGPTVYGEAGHIVTKDKAVTNEESNSRSRRLNEPPAGARTHEEGPATATTDTLPFDPGYDEDHEPPSPPPLSECNWSFLDGKDLEHLPIIQSMYEDMAGDYDAAGYRAFAKNPGGWNNMRQHDAIRVKTEFSHEAAFAAIVIAGIKGASSAGTVAKYFKKKGAPSPAGYVAYATMADILNWRRASAAGRPAEAYLEFRRDVKVNAHGEFFCRGRTISEVEALKIVNASLAPTKTQAKEMIKQDTRIGAPALKKLGRGVELDEVSGQYYVGGAPTEAGRAQQILSM